MRRDVLRRAGALLAACAVGLLLGPGAPVAQAQAQSANPQPVQAYGSCLKGQHTGDLLLLIDESGSLKTTDPGPEPARVRAANYLLDQLSGQTDQAKITLDVQIAGFATNFDRNPTPWTSLTPANLPGLKSTVNGFAQRVQGQDTDYWLALEGARRSLADHAKQAGPGEAGRCQAIAWFSDGHLDIMPRTSTRRQQEDGTTVPYADGVDLTTQAGADAAEQAAATSLCRPKGQADQLRSAHIVMFGVGLSPPGTPDGEFDLMRSITTGQPYQNQACGEIVDPTPGTFTPAADIDDLLFTFDTTLGTDIPTDPTAICAAADTACRGQEFVLDESIDGVKILGQADAVPGLTAELIDPDGKRYPLDVKGGQATDLTLGGAVRGTYTWQTDRSVNIEVGNGSRQPTGWRGVWALRFIDPAATASGTAKTNIRIWGNILPTWKNKKDTLASGAPVPDIAVGLVKAAGDPVDPKSLIGMVDMNVDLVDPAGNVTQVARNIGKDSVDTPLTLDLTSVKPGLATLRLSLNLTTAPAQRPGTGETVAGTTLSTQYQSVMFTVEPPLGYPRLPARVDFGSTEGTTDLTAPLTVTGPGCVWVPAEPAPTVSTIPDGVKTVAIRADGATSPQTCLSLGDGERRDVILHLQADHTGNGTASGTLPVSISPRDQPDQAKTVDVAFTGDLRTPINPVNFWATLIVALLLGPGIPLALLYLFKWATARIPARGLYAQLIPVTVAGGRTLRDNVPFGFREGDFVHLADIPSGGARRLVVGDVTLRTRIGASPFGSGHVSVEPANPQIACLSPGESQPHGYKLNSRLPLAVHRNWVVLHDPAGPPDAARVLVLIGADMPAAQREAFAAEIADRLPEVLDRLWGALDRSEKRGGRPPGGGTEAGTHWDAPAGAVPAYGPAGGYGPGSGTPTYGPGGGTPTYQPGGGTPTYGPGGTATYGPGGGTAPYGPGGTATYGPGGTATYGPPDHSSAGHGTPAYGPSGDGTGGYGPQAGAGTEHGAPAYGADPYGTAPYGADQYGAAPQGTAPYGGTDPTTSRFGGAPPTNQVTTPTGGGYYGPPPTPPGQSYGPPGQSYGQQGWDGGHSGDDEGAGNGATRPVGPGERRDPPDGGPPGPEHDPGWGPSYGPRS